MNTTPTYFLGLDLGQASDYSAVCAVERALTPRDPAAPDKLVLSFGVRFLHRWKLGTPYPDVVEELRAWGGRAPLSGALMAVDGTGVGRAVVDMIRRARLPLRVAPVVITGGEHEGNADGFLSVPKKNLVATLQTLVQTRRFFIAPALPDAKILGRELQQFRVKVKLATGNETFESWRERDHDDMVLAVAMACWIAVRQRPPQRYLASPPRPESGPTGSGPRDTDLLREHGLRRPGAAYPYYGIDEGRP